MKNFLIGLVLVVAGAAGAWTLMSLSRGPDAPPAAAHDHDRDGQDHGSPGAAMLHGDAADSNSPPCAKHGIPKSLCAFCDPTLIESLGFCRGHNVPEAFCTRCTPAIIPAFKVENDWCAEHNLPESQCAICNPGSGRAPAESSSEGHGLPGTTPQMTLVSQTKLQMRSGRSPSVSCSNERQVIRFASADVAAKAGLTTEPVQHRPIAQTLECNAELLFNGDRFAHITPRASGVIQRVEKQLGDPVRAGDTLAVIDSAELGSAKAELLQAHAASKLWQQNYERQRTLAQTGDTAQREVLEAETKLAEANITASRAGQRLRNLGLANEAIEEIKRTGDTTSLLRITAPFDAVVVDRHAVTGEVVDMEHILFSIADTRLMWAMLDVYEADAGAVALGQSVMLRLAGLEDQPVAGKVTWISPQVDLKTRTLKVRAEIENSRGMLRANMAGKAILTIRDRADLLMAPRQAIQWEGCCNVVFVPRSATEFQPRKVRLGYEVDGWCAIEEGLSGDELVVTQGSFLLKTELMKGSIGAGCCADH